MRLAIAALIALLAGTCYGQYAAEKGGYEATRAMSDAMASGAKHALRMTNATPLLPLDTVQAQPNKEELERAIEKRRKEVIASIHSRAHSSNNKPNKANIAARVKAIKSDEWAPPIFVPDLLLMSGEKPLVGKLDFAVTVAAIHRNGDIYAKIEGKRTVSTAYLLHGFDPAPAKAGEDVRITCRVVVFKQVKDNKPLYRVEPLDGTKPE